MQAKFKRYFRSRSSSFFGTRGIIFRTDYEDDDDDEDEGAK